MGAPETVKRHNSLLRELSEERAAALRRISGTLESLIDQLHARRAAIDASIESQMAGERESYEILRHEALRYRWYLDVQREALGFRRHEFVDEFYRVPGPIAVTTQTIAQGGSPG